MAGRSTPWTGPRSGGWRAIPDTGGPPRRSRRGAQVGAVRPYAGPEVTAMVIELTVVLVVALSAWKPAWRVARAVAR